MGTLRWTQAPKPRPGGSGPQGPAPAGKSCPVPLRWGQRDLWYWLQWAQHREATVADQGLTHGQSSVTTMCLPAYSVLRTRQDTPPSGPWLSSPVLLPPFSMEVFIVTLSFPHYSYILGMLGITFLSLCEVGRSTYRSEGERVLSTLQLSPSG